MISFSMLGGDDRKCLYRYSDGHRLEYNSCYSKPWLDSIPILRETEKSYFIEYDRPEGKRVPKDGRNLFAFDTKEKAWHNYVCRKNKQVSILEARLKKAKWYRNYCKEYLTKEIV